LTGIIGHARKVTNIGMQTLVGLASNQDVMPPQSNVLRAALTCPIILVGRKLIT